MNDQTNRTIRADTLEQTSNSALTQLCAQNEKKMPDGCTMYKIPTSLALKNNTMKYYTGLLA